MSDPGSAPAPAVRLEQLFAAQAGRSPDAVALEHGAHRLTYAELDAASNGLAHELRRVGATREGRVALLLDRSPEAVLALLATLKAGAAYVPIDPRLPRARIEFVLADAAPVVVVTRSGFAAQLPRQSPPAVVLDGRPGVADDRAPRSDPPAPAAGSGPADLAYLIYTSGSTGTPKGVAVEHTGLCLLAADQIERWPVGPGSRVLQFAPLGFDASVTEILVALLSGGTLCLADQDDLMPGVALHRTLRRLRITAVKATPGVLAATPCEELPELRSVVSGGGPCRPEVRSRWSRGRRFMNAYGVTEASVCSSMTAPLVAGARITLGRPVQGTSLRVVADGRDVSAGEVGELVLGGPGVARGYWRCPELTAERFRPAASGGPDARVYLTGDLVRVLPDGELEYVGRVDDQVKIRGNRVEPGEVEAALAEHPAVGEVAVLARPGADGEPRLVAYIVAAGGAGRSATGLRAFVAGRLPAYMVPAAVVELDRMPRTRNGKLDRNALPDPPGPAGGAVPVPEPVDDASPTEGLVLRIWREVLAIDEIDLRDDFFHLGGDSLQAAAVLARVREEAGVEVRLRSLLLRPTVAGLAATVDDVMSTGGRPDRSRTTSRG